MNKISVIVIIIIGMLLLGSILISKSSDKQQSTGRAGTPVAKNSNLQFQTFTIDEIGEPLDEDNLSTAVSRNEARIEDVNDQIDEDLLFLNELSESMSYTNEPGINQ